MYFSHNAMFSYPWILRVILALLTFVKAVTSFNVSDGNALHSWLLTTYNRDVRPSATVDVYMTFHLHAIDSLIPADPKFPHSEEGRNSQAATPTGTCQCTFIQDGPFKPSFYTYNFDDNDIRTQQLSSSGRFSLTWTDERLVWNPAEYSDIRAIYVHEYDVWLPQLVVDNSVNSIQSLSGSKLLITVTSSGRVQWDPPGVYLTHCDIDSTWYPFDKQSCLISVLSWSQGVSTLNMTNSKTEISMADYKPNGEWVITATSVTPSEKDGRSHIDLALVMERRCEFYVLNVILPVFFISFLIPVVFKLPPESGERVSFSLTVVIAFEVVLMVVAAHMPSTSLHISVIEVFLVLILTISALSVLSTVIVLHLFHKDGDMAIPELVKTAIGHNQQMKKTVNFRKPLNTEISEEAGTSFNPVRKDNEEEAASPENCRTLHLDSRSDFSVTFRGVSALLDSTLFWVFSILTITCDLLFIVVMAFGGP